jgi:ComF family protein
VERELLGRTAVSFIRRATEQGWAPDEASAYCHRCAESLGPYEGAREPGCPGCRSARLPWERALRLGTYHTLLRRAIHELKFTRWRRVGMELGALLGAMIASEIDAAGESRQGVAIVPIPSSYRRRLVRGIDHTQVLVQAIARTTGLQIVHALSRRHGPSQVSVPQSERTANVRDAFVHKGTIPSGIRVLIVVDDVRTTGATLTAATKALRTLLRTPGRENVRLWTAVVAVTPSPVSGRRNPVWSSGPI